MIHTDPSKRHDFVLIFDVKDGNPNGDPDGGNMPRTDPETRQGLVSDVAIKRKIRNFVAMVAADATTEKPESASRLKIFIEHHSVLNEQIRRAYVELGIPTGKPIKLRFVDREPKEGEIKADAQLLELLKNRAMDLPDAFNFREADEENTEPATLEYSGELSTDELKAALDEIDDLEKPLRKLLEDAAKKSGKPDKNRANADKAKDWMRANFYDVRMFGAVMSTGLNAGQVRGPMQLTFARSVDPVFPRDLAITRVAVTDAKDREKLQTIGRKAQIPYGLYVGHGFYSPHLANGSKPEVKVTTEDLELFWQALVQMWDVDRSASRGYMAPRGIFVFTHENKFGNAPAHKLFDLIKPSKKPDVEAPRSIEDYEITSPPEGSLAEYSLAKYPGVTLTRLV